MIRPFLLQLPEHTTVGPSEREPYNSSEMETLLAASSRGDLPILERLLPDNKDIDTRGSLLEDRSADGQEKITMLQAAASHGQLEVIEYLIRKGANVNLQNDGETRLLTAAYQGQSQVPEILIANGADINHKRFRGASALHEAVANVSGENLGKIAVVETLLSHGIDIEVADEDGHTALHCAALYGNLENGADVNARNNWGYNPLNSAASGGHLETAELLLDKGAEVNNNGKEEGCNGLGQAARHGHTSTVALLLDRGRQGTISTTHEPRTARSGTAATVSLLYQRGCAHQGPPSLFKAILTDPSDVVKLLLHQGVDINARDTTERSVLHFAVLGQRFERSNAHGVLHAGWEVLRFLLENGADATAEGSSGQTAKDLAVASNYIEAVELLESGNIYSR